MWSCSVKILWEVTWRALCKRTSSLLRPWPHQLFAKTIRNRKSRSLRSQRQYNKCRSGGWHSHEAACLISRHLWLCHHGNKAAAKRKCAVGQRQFKRSVERAGGWETMCPVSAVVLSYLMKCGRHLWPIIMVHWCHLIHIPPLSHPPMCLYWMTYFKSFKLKNVTDWNLFTILIWESWLGKDDIVGVNRRILKSNLTLNLLFWVSKWSVLWFDSGPGHYADGGCWLESVGLVFEVYLHQWS